MRVRSMPAAPVLALLLVTVLAGPASAGGWATVELSSTPDGVRAGEEWVVDLKILQHGRTPLEDVRPAVTISQPDRGRSERFVARETEEPGVYRASVTFPNPGEWEYRVDDGFGQVQAYPVVNVEDEAPPVAAPAASTRAATGGGLGAAAIAGIVALGVAAAALTFVVLRRRGSDDTRPGARPTPARS